MLLRIFLVACLATLALTGAQARPSKMGHNITVRDAFAAGEGWFGVQEDNETEPNARQIKGQEWDLEAVYVQDNILTLVGGFDFKHGAWAGEQLSRSGHLFIDVDGDAQPGAAQAVPSVNGVARNAFGYDFVVTFDFESMTSTVYAIDAETTVTLCSDGAASMPCHYVAGGRPVPGYQGRPITYQAGLSAQDVGGFRGDGRNERHYALRINTGFMPTRRGTFSFTTEGGYDTLLGHTTHDPEVRETLLMTSRQQSLPTPTRYVAVPDQGSSLALLSAAIGLLAVVQRLRRTNGSHKGRQTLVSVVRQDGY